MRARRLTVVIATAIGLVANATAMASAQDGEDASEPSTPAVVTGNILGVGELVQEPVEAVVDGVRQWRGFVLQGEQMEADDPRLTGTVSVAVSHDWRTIGDTEAVLISAVQRIENDEGAWSGMCNSLTFANDGRPDPSTCLFSGEGAYDGLSAYLVSENPEEPPIPFEGLIFEGGLPPFPEADDPS